MSPLRIQPFMPNNISELAREQTRIYNEAISDFPDYLPADVEKVISRFQQKEFDPKRMFYAYDGQKMVGFASLGPRDFQNNLRTIRYPWVLKGTASSVRDLLYNAMEKQCRLEGTKTMRTFVFTSYTDIIDFFTSKNFSITQKFVIMEKRLFKNTFSSPPGYKFRLLKKEDLSKLETISLHDPKIKYRFTPSDWSQFLNLSEFNPDDGIVAEKDGKIVGFYVLSFPSDPTRTKAYIAGEAINPENQIIEPFLVMELENRALKWGMKTIETSFYAESKRVRLAAERGFQKTGINLRLDKTLR